MIQQKATVLWNRPLGADCYHLGLACPQGYDNARPGQFVMVQIAAKHEPLLRRPFSIFGLLDENQFPKGIELLYKVVGRGTAQMARLAPDQHLDILGPLGHSFKHDPGHKLIYLAAGGIGVAPIRFLAQRVIAQGGNASNCRVFLGGRSQDDLLCRTDFTELGMSVTITTDDGSAGDQCLITDPLASAIMEHPPDVVYACGPHGMLACVAGIVARQGVACQVSVESMMACGIGACLGCAVEDRRHPGTYLHVCINGPVFDINDLCLEDSKASDLWRPGMVRQF